MSRQTITLSAHHPDAHSLSGEAGLAGKDSPEIISPEAGLAGYHASNTI